MTALALSFVAGVLGVGPALQSALACGAMTGGMLLTALFLDHRRRNRRSTSPFPEARRPADDDQPGS